MAVVRIGALVVDLDQCALREFPESPCIEIYWGQRCFTFTKQGDPIEYRALKAYMARKTPLLNEHDQKISEIVSNAFDPFIDTEKLTAIYSLFNEILTQDQLLLVIESEEIGSIRSKDDPSQSVVEWKTAIEAVDRIHAYRRQVNEAVLP